MVFADKPRRFTEVSKHCKLTKKFVMVSETLLGSKDNFRSQKILVAAKYAGKDLNLQENLEPEPSLKVQDKTLCKSLAIAYFVSDEALRGGTNEVNKAECLQWLFFGEQDLLPVIFNHIFPILDLMPKAKENDKNQKELFRLLEYLNTCLKTKTFLVGERLSLADISVCLNLTLLFKHGLLANDRDKFTYLMRWFNTIIHQKHVQDVIGPFQYCQELKALPSQSQRTSG